jgi:hypothetical protein
VSRPHTSILTRSVSPEEVCETAKDLDSESVKETKQIDTSTLEGTGLRIRPSLLLWK